MNWEKVKPYLVFWIIIVLGCTGVISALWALGSWVTIPQGYALIIVDATKPEKDKVSEPIMGPIAGFYLDWFKTILGKQYGVSIYYEMTSVEMWTEWKQDANRNWIEDRRGEYPAIYALSKDGLEIEVDILVRWQLDSATLRHLYMSYPNLNWRDLTINSIIREKTRDTISRYTAIDVIENRETIAQNLSQNILNGILAEQTIKDSIKNLSMDLRSIDPSTEFIAAITKKLEAEQANLQAQYEYTRQITLAQAEARSKMILANGTREAIAAILSVQPETNSTRIAELYIYMEGLKAITPNAKFLIINLGGQGTPLILPTNSTTIP